MEKNVEFYELTFAPGGELDSDAHFAGTREMLSVAKGSVEVAVGVEPPTALAQGDTAHYPADRKHKIANRGGEDAVCYLVVSYA